ncbi:MAG TPA: NUDIX hydrolase [Patescibacteria group bacterium]|nr:NUDIX hydrolase [Patescibacteria group bacterium]
MTDQQDVLAGAGIIVFKNDTVLLVRHKENASHLTGLYGIPAGTIASGESEQQTAVRELREETGLLTSEDDLVEYPENFYIADIERKEGMRKCSLRVFICHNYEGDIESLNETVPEWISLSDLTSYPLLPNVQQMVTDAKKYEEEE